MPTFKQPVSMQVTKEQFESDLKEPLKDLGYKISENSWGKTDVLVNNLNGYDNIISNLLLQSKDKYSRHFIDHYNPELFLALAAIIESKRPVAGEYWKFEERVYRIEQIGESYSILSSDGRILTHQYSTRGFSNINWSKLTKEELINYFTKQQNMSNKKIIGYKLTKTEYRNAALAIVPDSLYLKNGKTLLGHEYITEGSEISRKIKEAGVLHLWFENVYESQEQIFKVGNFEIKVKDNQAFHKNDNITTFVKCLGVMMGPDRRGTFGGYNFVVKDVIFSETGCEKGESKLSEWLEVCEAIK